MSTLPWDIGEAAQALRNSSSAQKAAEDTLRSAVKEYAACEQRYREALASAITTLRAEGAAATTAADLARGNPTVARLRFARDVAEGMKEAAMQVGWRASADRKDAQSLALWSMRRELAEHGGEDSRLSFSGGGA